MRSSPTRASPTCASTACWTACVISGAEPAAQAPMTRVEPFFLERHAGDVLGFGDAVAVGDEHVARVQHLLAGRVGRALEQAERDAGGVQLLDAAVGAADARRVLPGVHPLHAPVGLEHGEEDRDEPRARRVAQQLHVEALEQRARRQPLVDERAQHGEEQGHQQRRRTALAGDVAERDDHASVGERDHVEEVAADRVGRPRVAVHLDARRAERALRQHRALDVARDVQVVLERQAIGDLEHDQQVEQHEADAEEDDAVVPGRDRQADLDLLHLQQRHEVEAGEQLDQADDGRDQRDHVDAPGAPATAAS